MCAVCYVLFVRLCAGIRKHVRFCWIVVGRLAEPPSPPYLVHPRSRQCFQAFCNTFHAQSCCDFFLRQFPKRLAQGARPAQNSFPQTVSLFVARDRGSLQILGLELASEDIPYRIRASGLPPGALAVISQDNKIEERPKGVSDRSPSPPIKSLYPQPMVTKPSSKPRSPWFQKPVPIENFYRFSCRARKSVVQQLYSRQW
jgi:hypothetical protein